MLPGDSPTAFAALVQCLYQEKFMTVTKDEASDKPPIYGEALKIVFLASKYSISELLDGATTACIQGLRISGVLAGLDIVDQTAIAFIILSYQNNDSGGSWTNAKLNVLFKKHDELLLDVMDLVRGQVGITPMNPGFAPHCEFHEHAEAAICPYQPKPPDPDTFEA